MPIDYSLYPPNWFSELRPAVLKRAGHACENCQAKEYDVVRWNSKTEAYESYQAETPTTYRQAVALWVELKASHFYDDWTIIKLAIAHIDHDIGNNDLSNLKALCNRCHLAHDRYDNARRKKFGKHYERNQFKLNFNGDNK